MRLPIIPTSRTGRRSEWEADTVSQSTCTTSIAYFSMEVGIRPEMPTYAGGLGMLAGDTITSAADAGLPLLAVTLLHRSGYFYQRLDSSGRQVEEPMQWVPEDFLIDSGERIQMTIEGRTVTVRAWTYELQGIGGAVAPVYFLDTDLEGNSEWDRTLTHWLYGGDQRYRLCQEAVLGIGGVRILRALGYAELSRFHLNEGHAALLTLELLREERERAGRTSVEEADLAAIRRRCVFTTHTPVPSGHDQFPQDLVESVLGDCHGWGINDAMCHEGRLNMTFLALSLSHYVNGVAKKHGEVSRNMFAGYTIDAITNGAHVGRWTAPALAALYDRHLAGWRQDNFSLRSILGVPSDDLWAAHQSAKNALVAFVNHETNAGLDTAALTIGFARRAAAYKRLDLIFESPERLRAVRERAGRLQLVCAAKAHPSDEVGKEQIQRLVEIGRSLRPEIGFAFLPNYDMDVARLMISGSDVWLNTPEPPMEASGTSGMKAAFNGVPSLSVLDGWWLEGCLEGVTGWSIGPTGENNGRSKDSEFLYAKLEGVIAPMFYNDRGRYIELMRHTIAINGSFFNTQRMLQEYAVKAYLE